jgi:large subunit ribosomal protein L4
MAALGFEGKTLVVDTIDNDNLLLASRNVKGAKVVGAAGVNIYDVLYHEKLILTRAAAEALQAQLDPKKAGVAGATEDAEDDGQKEEEAA